MELKEHQKTIQEMITYGKTLIGKPYCYWTGENFTNIDDGPMWSFDGPITKKINSINCAGLINLLFRHVNIPIPFSKLGGKGGTLAYYEYYKKVAEPFDPNTIYPIGTLIGRKYYDIKDQGHIAIVTENQYILQSFDPEGVNMKYMIKESNETDTGENYYEYAVLPKYYLINKQSKL